MSTTVRPVVDKINIRISDSSGKIKAFVSARPPRTVITRVMGPQGPAGTTTLGTVTVVNPDQNPSITASGTARDRIFNFGLPRASTFAVGTVTAGADIDSAAVTNVGTNGDVVLDIVAPRATVNVGSTTTVNPDVNPSVANSGTDAAVVLDFDLPRASEFSVEPVNVVNPNQPPSVILSSNEGDYDIEFTLPRSVDVSVGTTVTVNPDVNPLVASSVDSNGDVIFDFDLPRAPTFSVGTVGVVGPSDPATATDVGTDGDVVIDFGLPRGEKGWGPVFLLANDGSRRVLQVEDWVGGEGTKPAIGAYVGSSGLVFEIENAVDIRGEAGPATDTPLAGLPDVNISDVEQGQALAYNSATSEWVNTFVSPLGGGINRLFYENDQKATEDYIISEGQNAVSAGPIEIEDSVLITVPAGSSWVVV